MQFYGVLKLREIIEEIITNFFFQNYTKDLYFLLTNGTTFNLNKFE